jgi:hypothetical protein
VSNSQTPGLSSQIGHTRLEDYCLRNENKLPAFHIKTSQLSNLDISLRNEDKLFSVQLSDEDGVVEFGLEVSPPNCAPPGLDATQCFKTLPCATYVSSTPPCSFSFSEKSAFEDPSELRTWLMLEQGLNRQSQDILLESWKQGEYLTFATKYKPVSKKIKPMPVGLNPPLKRPPLSRDPYPALPSALAGPFVPHRCVTQERLSVVDFGPYDWLSLDGLNLIKKCSSAGGEVNCL